MNNKKTMSHPNQEDKVVIKLRKVLGNLSEYILIGIVLEERAKNGDSYAIMLIETVERMKNE